MGISDDNLINRLLPYTFEFFETQAELANLPNLPKFPAKFAHLPNSVKIKSPLNTSKFKF